MFVFLQNSNLVGGIVVNNQISGFKSIKVYDNFYFFIWISAEYVSLSQCFKNMFN